MVHGKLLRQGLEALRPVRRWCGAFLGAAVVLCLLAASGRAANPVMSDDFDKIIGWLTFQTAQGLGFNAGSTFDPPNEMRPWRMQPDVSLGIGMMPFDKGTFPEMEVEALAEKDMAGMLPDKVMFPNLTFHVRMGLPKRMDMGVRVVNMTTPKNYRLSESTVGNGQSNTIGFSLRRHFFGRGDQPLVSVTGAYNHVKGYFNFKNQFEDVELVDGILWASSENTGNLDWDVKSYGVNMIVSQAFGKWTPFAGMGLSYITGNVKGRLEANWETPLIQPSVGEAESKPEAQQSRAILGVQRDGSFFKWFVNAEMKTTGFQSNKAFIISTGLAAPFRIGANSSLARERSSRPKLAQWKDGELFEVREKTRRSKSRRRRRRRAEKYERTIDAEKMPELIFIQ